MKSHKVVTRVITHNKHCASPEAKDACLFAITLYNDNSTIYPSSANCCLFRTQLQFDLLTTHVPNRCQECIKEFGE